MADIIGLIVALAVCFLIFWVCRGIMLWYWKINQIVALLEDIKRNTAKDGQAPVK